MKGPTMRDIAATCGLSVFTVSRALSGADGVSDSSRAAVQAAAEELGYVPDRRASELRRASRRTVTVLIADTANAYYIDLLTGIQRAVRASGRSAVVADIAALGRYTADDEDRVVQEMIASRTAGVISTMTLADNNIAMLRKWDIPMVFVDSAAPAGHEDLPAVTVDNVSASGAVGAHLAEHGATDWLFVAYPERWSTRRAREQGLRQAAELHDAHLTVCESENHPDAVFAMLTAHYPDGAGLPGAIVAGDNPIALGVLRFLREHRLRIPDDIAVIAFDEFPWAPMLDPPLTVVNENSEAIGEVAAQTLMRLIDDQVEAESNGETTRPQYRAEDRIQMPAELIVRKSCGC